jgi:hypothetical protein
MPYIPLVPIIAVWVFYAPSGIVATLLLFLVISYRSEGPFLMVLCRAVVATLCWLVVMLTIGWLGVESRTGLLHLERLGQLGDFLGAMLAIAAVLAFLGLVELSES